MLESINPTKKRILDAAGEVFAEVGFQAATIRDICTRADANVAAINYHFRDKAGLYSAVLVYAHQEALAKYPPDLGVSKSNSPEERLSAFIRSFLSRIYDQGRPAWHTKLISREMIEPTHALDAVVETGVQPQIKILSAIIAEMLKIPADSPEIKLAASSVIGQCLHYHNCRHVLCRLEPGIIFDSARVQLLADHIITFSLGGIAAQRAKLAKEKK